MDPGPSHDHDMDPGASLDHDMDLGSSHEHDMDQDLVILWQSNVCRSNHNFISDHDTGQLPDHDMNVNGANNITITNPELCNVCDIEFFSVFLAEMPPRMIRIRIHLTLI